MKYTEMIALYKEGKLDDEKKKEIQDDIERHEAISDYLYENEQIPSVLDVEGGTEDNNEKEVPSDEERKKTEEQARQETEKIIKQIKKRFRRAFIRFGILLLALVLIVAAVFEWVIPNWQKSRYYDPIGTIPEHTLDHPLKLEKEMQIYTNLFAPDKTWDNIDVTDLGSGNYNINVRALYPDSFSLVRQTNLDFGRDYYKQKIISGKISQGVLELNGENVFTPRTSYPFYPALAGVSNESRVKFYGSKGDRPTSVEKDVSSVASVNNSGVYNVYITFDKVYGDEEAIKLLFHATENDSAYGSGMMSMWFAACQKVGGTYEASTTLGFFVNCRSYSRYYNYAGIELDGLYNVFSSEDTYYQNILRGEIDKVFSDSLRYIADTEDFTKMNGCNEILPYQRKTDSEKYFEDGYPEDGIEYPENTDLDTRYECLSAYLNRFADNVENNGVYVYGCYYEGIRGETIKELAKDSHISYLYIENVG